MNEEYKEKLLNMFEYLQKNRNGLEDIIDLIKNSNEISRDSKMQVTTFLEGYSEGLKVTVEWLNRIIP